MNQQENVNKTNCPKLAGSLRCWLSVMLFSQKGALSADAVILLLIRLLLLMLLLFFLLWQYCYQQIEDESSQVKVKF